MDDKTVRVGSNIADGATIRVDSPQPTQSADQQAAVETTLRPSAQHVDDKTPGEGDFILKGKVYHPVKCLSDSSGEAQVYLVEGSEGLMVLKVYYPNYTINKQVMPLIKSFSLEMIVHVADYGKTYVEGKNRDYELMEYLQGGTLLDYDLNGDFNQFRRIALQAAAALAYCHQYSVIHKDIKPGNFFFRDTDHKQVVLGDFGISSLMGNDERMHRTTQARTPVYAAPEMYNDVIDGEVEITPAADFYSLGITLMTLWLGENPFFQNERAIMRKKNEGRLPRINELPERVRMIIQGLTTVNPQSRWGYDEVERWFLGEEVKVDLSSPLLRYRSFVVDPEHNLVADNIHELIPLLLDNERLAVNYLYSGRIAGWLEQSGNVKLSAAVKDIVMNRYPVDQKAGLLSAVYTMEPSYPYKDLRNNLCDDIHSLAISVLSYQEEYSIALKNPNDSLFLYLESHTKTDIQRLRGYFNVNSLPELRIAILKLVYEVDAEIPFLAKHPSATLEEIVHSFGYEDCTEDEWESISDGRLLAWMYNHEDKMACESLRIMTQDRRPTRSLGYKVLYNLYRDAAFDLRDADTPYKVGEILNRQMQEWQSLSEQEFSEMIFDYANEDGRFLYFAQLHGWFEQMSMARACFDLKSEENRDRLSAYDLRTAAYRFCRQLGVTPSYVLEGGIELKDGRQLPVEGQRPKLFAAMKRGALSQWMSVFYHENPAEEFVEPYSYEHTLQDWVEALGRVDPNQFYHKRYMNAKQETANKYKEVRQNYRRAKAKEHTWRITFYSLSALWLVLLIIFGVDRRDEFLAHAWSTVVLPVGGVTALIAGMRAFFRGYGFLFCTLWAAIGLMSAWIPVFLLRYVHVHYDGMFTLTMIAITLVYFAICHITDYRSDTQGDSQLINVVMEDDVKTSLIDPLYYTFKQKSYKFKGSKFGVLDDVNNQVRSISGESVVHYMTWSLLMAVIVLEMICFSPSLLNMNKSDLKKFKPREAVQQFQNNTLLKQDNTQIEQDNEQVVPDNDVEHSNQVE